TRRGRNLMLTMLLGGLWHGAAWHFVAWGGLHGSYLMGEAALKKRVGHWALWQRPLPQILLMMLTFVLVCLTWVFFRAERFSHASLLIVAMLGMGAEGAALNPKMMLASAVCLGLVLTHYLLRNASLEEAAARLPSWISACAVAAMVLLICMTHGESRGF